MYLQRNARFWSINGLLITLIKTTYQKINEIFTWLKSKKATVCNFRERSDQSSIARKKNTLLNKSIYGSLSAIIKPVNTYTNQNMESCSNWSYHLHFQPPRLQKFVSVRRQMSPQTTSGFKQIYWLLFLLPEVIRNHVVFWWFLGNN